VATLNEVAEDRHFTLPGKVALAQKDTDLDPLRGRPDFAAFLAAITAK
jgi:hypothetical protein